MAKETAEQKLLRLIEQGDGSDSSSAQSADSSAGASSSADPQQVLNAVQSFGGAFAIPPFISQMIAMLKGAAPASGEGFGIRELNKLLIVIVLVMSIIFASNLLNGMRLAKRKLHFDEPGSAPFSVETFLPQFPKVQDYLDAVSSRNIFHPYEKKVAEEAGPDESVVAQKISNQTKDLKLVGISWLDTPESASAMVENTANGVTYFLRIGEKINGVTVEAIYADSIVLEFSGERMELKL